MPRSRFLVLLCLVVVLEIVAAQTARPQPAKDAPPASSTEKPAATKPPAKETLAHPADAALDFIFTGFEHASPLSWEFAADGSVQVYLVYDQERASPNRANGHWFFQLQGRPGGDVTLVLNNFDNVWNGRKGSPISAKTIGFTSPDGKTWKPIAGKLLEGNRLQFQVNLGTGTLWMARLPVYGLQELEAFKAELARKPDVEITTIGNTVEGRPLEIIRVGQAGAPRRVVLRARAHPWEPGGNWVVEGLLRHLAGSDEAAAKLRAQYAVYVMPMANKDGVARGRTRFNLQGKDLNRQWDQPADPQLAPENAALEAWIKAMVDRGQRPDLLIDFHNDEGGRLHISRPDVDLQAYLARIKRLEELLVKHTWFREGSTGSNFRNPGTIGEGLLERFGVHACVLEFNANWIAGVNDYPSAEHWRTFGRQLAMVFSELVAEMKP